MCKFCRKIFCCCCNRRSLPEAAVTDLTRLLPRNEATAHILEKQELIVFGDAPKNPDGLFLNEEKYGQNPVKKIVCGKNHCLILTNNNQILGFGSNDSGQLGLPLNVKICEVLTEIKIINLENFEISEIIDIAAGDHFSLVLLKGGEDDFRIVKFGISEKEKYLTDSSLQTQRILTFPMNLIPSFLCAKGARAMVVSDNGAIFVHGRGFRDHGTIENIELLSQFGSGVKKILLTRGGCLVIDNRNIMYGIGDNTYSEFGETVPSMDEFKIFPYEFKNVKKVVSGARHILILLENGDLFAMGDNSEHQCFAKTSICRSPTRVEIDRNSKIIDVFAGDNHNLAILEDHSVFTWGNASYGKLGYPEEKFSEDIPKEIVELRIKYINYVCLGERMTIISTGKEINALYNKGKNQNNNDVNIDITKEK